MVDADADSRPVRSITESLLAISTLPLPIPRIEHKEKTRERDYWLMLTILVALVGSIASTIYYYNAHETLLYSDSHSHLGIARRLFDSSNPWDITQLGAVWLPLPHILMWPFVWNDFLWHSGLAGSIVSMTCYLITACYIYKFAFRLTRNGAASIIGTSAFILNPDVLYIQTTPLSEMVCAATFMASSYYFLRWAQEDRTCYLSLSAAAMFLATLSRYDNWALFLVFLVLVGVISWVRHLSRAELLAHIIIYGSLASFGIMLWFIWNKVIFGNPLYFQDGPYSAATQNSAFLKIGQLFTYHSVFLSIKFYGADVVQILGQAVILLAALGLVAYLIANRWKKETFVVLALLTPFVFYVYSLYSGNAIIYVPGMEPTTAVNPLFNVRYGIAMAAPCAVLVAPLVASLRIKWRMLATVFQIVVLTTVIGQAMLTSHTNIVLEDGLHGISCEIPLATNRFLAQYYNGGKVLEDNFTSRVDGGEAGFNFRDVIYEGSGDLWSKAIEHPARYAKWIVLNSNPDDLVRLHMEINNNEFLTQYTLVASDKSSTRLYHLKSDPLVKVHSIPDNFLSEYSKCAIH